MKLWIILLSLGNKLLVLESLCRLVRKGNLTYLLVLLAVLTLHLLRLKRSEITLLGVQEVRLLLVQEILIDF